MMNDQEPHSHPFLQSRRDAVPQETSRFEAIFAARSLGEMAIILGVGAAAALVLCLIIAVGIAASLKLSRTQALYLVAALGVMWLICVVGFFVFLARIVRICRTHASDADLFWLQSVFLGGFLASIAALPPKSFSWHDAFLTLEWIVIALHTLYFLLAVSARLRLAWWKYAVFVLLVGIASAQTLLRK